MFTGFHLFVCQRLIRQPDVFFILLSDDVPKIHPLREEQSDDAKEVRLDQTWKSGCSKGKKKKIHIRLSNLCFHPDKKLK